MEEVMKLTLENNYPFPYPDNLTEAEGDAIADQARDRDLVLKGVKCFEWLHTVTVEFVDYAAYDKAKDLTGWERWGTERSNILEAKTSAEDGYGHPAIIAGGRAWCGFILSAD
jgi:hypothetical protein